MIASGFEVSRGLNQIPPAKNLTIGASGLMPIMLVIMATGRSPNQPPNNAPMIIHEKPQYSNIRSVLSMLFLGLRSLIPIIQPSTKISPYPTSANIIPKIMK